MCGTCRHWDAPRAIVLPDGRVASPCSHPDMARWHVRATGGMNCNRWQGKEADDGSRT